VATIEMSFAMSKGWPESSRTGNEAGLRRGSGRERIGVRIVEHDGGKVGVVAGEVSGEKRAESYP